MLYANLKKCYFYQEKVRFLDYIISYKGIQIKEKQIKAIQNQLKSQSIGDIQVFLGSANFY